MAFKKLIFDQKIENTENKFELLNGEYHLVNDAIILGKNHSSPDFHGRNSALLNIGKIKNFSMEFSIDWLETQSCEHDPWAGILFRAVHKNSLDTPIFYIRPDGRVETVPSWNRPNE